MEIYLIRHPETILEEGICYGHLDVGTRPPNEILMDKLKLLGQKDENFSVYSSPSSRCLSVARIIGKEKVIVDDRWMEMNFGDWEGKKWSSIDKEELEIWMKDFVSLKSPNGESYQDLFKRSTKAFFEMAEKKGGISIIITHAGVIRSVISRLLEIPLEKSFSLRIDYDSLTKITTIGELFYIDYINLTY